MTRASNAAVLAAITAMFLPGCASIVEGTDQTVNVQVSPENAVCQISQKGSVIATLDKGGGQVQVPKSKDDLGVDCSAPGFERQTVSIESSASGWGVVGCFLIDLCITDYATGALNKYPKSISVRLRQLANIAPSAGPNAQSNAYPSADPNAYPAGYPSGYQNGYPAGTPNAAPAPAAGQPPNTAPAAAPSAAR
jgi:hypothetical protein